LEEKERRCSSTWWGFLAFITVGGQLDLTQSSIMKHTMKMVLVPHESVARLQEKPTAPTPQSQMSSLDSEMDQIMRKKYVDDSEKWKQYSETLQRYLHFAGENRKPISIELEPPEDKQDTVKNDNALRDQLGSVMPKTYKAAGLKIYDYLSSDTSPVRWDSTGTVSISGAPLPSSNIIDLISDLTRSRKNFEPYGVEKFVQALAQMNIPLALVANERRRTTILRFKEGRSQQTGSGIKKTVRLKSSPQNKVKKRRVKKVNHVWKNW
jgi:hypothetical protein